MNALLALALLACAQAGAPGAQAGPTRAAPEVSPGQEQALFASGCFWCTEKDFEGLAGVLSVESGYVGGAVTAPSYAQVSRGGTGHAEAVRVLFDPSKTSYDALLEHYWRHVDFTDGGGQFCDRGSQYRPALFPVSAAQRTKAEASKQAIAARFGVKVAVTVENPTPFWLAEEYHQDFYTKDPVRYNGYRQGCGRDRRVAELWAAAK